MPGEPVNRPVILAVDDTPENLDVVKGILGAADYVAKPIDPDTLLFSVRRQLNADGSDK